MKLISLWEPWATLMALGAKKIETRSWGTSYRGWVAIHATKGGLCRRDLESQCCETQFRQALAKSSAFAGWLVYRHAFQMPARRIFSFGHILAIGELYDCRMVDDPRWKCFGYPDRMMPPSEPELSFGNYETGRYCLFFHNMRRLRRPVPFTSRQGKLLDIPLELARRLHEEAA